MRLEMAEDEKRHAKFPILELYIMYAIATRPESCRVGACPSSSIRRPFANRRHNVQDYHFRLRAPSNHRQWQVTGTQKSLRVAR